MSFNWVSPKVTVADCDMGKGQRAIQEIARGELLAVFGGRVMTLKQFDELPAALQRFPYQVGENPDLLFGPTRAEDISDGDFFNHSCNPNAGFHDAIRLVAMRAIAAGEQVTFDYATCMTGTFGNMACGCGDAGCRRYITGDDWTIPWLQAKYAGYWQPYIQAKIEVLRRTSSTAGRR